VTLFHNSPQSTQSTRCFFSIRWKYTYLQVTLHTNSLQKRLTLLV